MMDTQKIKIGSIADGQGPAAGPTDQQRLLNEVEAARWLNCSVAWLRKRRLLKLPPNSKKMGRMVRYSAEELKDFIANCDCNKAA